MIIYSRVYVQRVVIPSPYPERPPTPFFIPDIERIDSFRDPNLSWTSSFVLFLRSASGKRGIPSIVGCVWDFLFPQVPL